MRSEWETPGPDGALLPLMVGLSVGLCTGIALGLFLGARIVAGALGS